MKKIALFLLSFGMFINSFSQDEPKHNEELLEIFLADQADRQTDEIDWKVVSKRDRLREIRIYELLDSNKVQTSRDIKMQR